MEVKHKLAVVTGGARRVGRALVEALAGDGAIPVIHCHSSVDRARALARAHEGHVVQADLSTAGGAEALADQVLALGGELALWVNSASRFERAALTEAPDELWTRTLELGLLAPVRCIQRVAPAMVDGGVIVNVLDVAARQPWRGYAHHCVTKAALAMLTRCMALELAPRLRVCGVAPGLVLPAGDMDPAQLRRLERRIPLERRGSPRDVAAAVRFIVGADYLTGSVLTVDGGMSVRSIGA